VGRLIARNVYRRLKETLALNQPLATAYYLKEDLRRFWDQPGKSFATTFLDGWIRRAEASGIKILQLQQTAKTLAAHRTGLLNGRPVNRSDLFGTTLPGFRTRPLSPRFELIHLSPPIHSTTAEQHRGGRRQRLDCSRSTESMVAEVGERY
jgi:hypothetical protein